MRKLIVAALLIVLAVTLCGCMRTEGADDDLGGRFTDTRYQGARVITDNKTGVQYLLVKLGYGAGLTVLLDEDGKPMIAGGES